MAPNCARETQEKGASPAWALTENDDSMLVESCNILSKEHAPIDKSCKRVRFSADLHIIDVPRRTDLSHGELHDRWFREDDYAEVQIENNLTQRAMYCEDNYHWVDDEVLCSQGLVDDENLEARAEKSLFVQRLVLNQLAFLIENDSLDLDLIAKVYHDCAMPAVERALEVARRDAEEASLYQGMR